MSKPVALKWDEFMRGEIVPRKEIPKKALVGGGALYLTTIPKVAMASAAEESWMQVWVSVLHIADWLCVGVITFAGAVWMFGNRSKAIELLIGSSSGYLVIRHAVEIRDWLSTL